MSSAPRILPACTSASSSGTSASSSAWLSSTYGSSSPFAFAFLASAPSAPAAPAAPSFSGVSDAFAGASPPRGGAAHPSARCLRPAPLGSGGFPRDGGVGGTAWGVPPGSIGRRASASSAASAASTTAAASASGVGGSGVKALSLRSPAPVGTSRSRQSASASASSSRPNAAAAAAFLTPSSSTSFSPSFSPMGSMFRTASPFTGAGPSEMPDFCSASLGSSPSSPPEESADGDLVTASSATSMPWSTSRGDPCTEEHLLVSADVVLHDSDGASLASLAASAPSESDSAPLSLAVRLRRALSASLDAKIGATAEGSLLRGSQAAYWLAIRRCRRSSSEPAPSAALRTCFKDFAGVKLTLRGLCLRSTAPWKSPFPFVRPANTSPVLCVFRTPGSRFELSGRGRFGRGALLCRVGGMAHSIPRIQTFARGMRQVLALIREQRVFLVRATGGPSLRTAER